jgi:septal ring factor EnvC (AmiA/AmiB activator)
MKKIAITIIAGLLMSAAVPVFAVEMTKEEKDQCLLATKNCSTEVDSIQKKMKKLDAEIKKGKRVYTAEELKNLQNKLQEANDMLDTLLGLKGGN